MITGKTKTGFTFNVDERKAHSWSLVRKIAEMQKTKSQLEIYGLAIDIITSLIGEEQEKAIISHVTEYHGYDDADAVIEEIFDILRQARETPELKKSSSSEGASHLTRMPSSVISPNTTTSMNTETIPPNMSRPFAPDFGTSQG